MCFHDPFVEMCRECPSLPACMPAKQEWRLSWKEDKLEFHTSVAFFRVWEGAKSPGVKYLVIVPDPSGEILAGNFDP